MTTCGDFRDGYRNEIMSIRSSHQTNNQLLNKTLSL